MTYTDQYLTFHSHHPLTHKLGVIRTLHDQCYNIIIEDADAAAEINNVDKTLGRCGYPKLSFRNIRQSMVRRSRKEAVGRRMVTMTPKRL